MLFDVGVDAVDIADVDSIHRVDIDFDGRFWTHCQMLRMTLIIILALG